MTERKVKEVKDKHISFRITETEYNALKSIIQHMADVEEGSDIEETTMKLGVNNYVRLLVMKHVEPYILSHSAKVNDYETICKLQDVVKEGIKFNEAVLNKAMKDLEKMKKDAKFIDNEKES